MLVYDRVPAHKLLNRRYTHLMRVDRLRGEHQWLEITGRQVLDGEVMVKLRADVLTGGVWIGWERDEMVVAGAKWPHRWSDDDSHDGGAPEQPEDDPPPAQPEGDVVPRDAPASGSVR